MSHEHVNVRVLVADGYGSAFFNFCSMLGKIRPILGKLGETSKIMIAKNVSSLIPL